jgi:hypothetical protein
LASYVRDLRVVVALLRAVEALSRLARERSRALPYRRALMSPRLAGAETALSVGTPSRFIIFRRACGRISP